MPKLRTRVPQNIADELLANNNHCCCLCREPGKPVEIHHINGDPSNHDPDNLAVLCRNCHGIIEQKGPLGRSVGQGEVIRYKQEWEAMCDQNQDFSAPGIDEHKVVRIAAGEDRLWLYYAPAGSEIVLGFDSNVALTATIARESDYRRWVNDEETDVLDEEEDLYKGELEVQVDRDNNYAIWLTNYDDENAVVEVDISIWPSADDE